MDEHVDILKLPPHTTDRLQPLDVCCFRSLKMTWEKKLVKWSIKNKAKRVTKHDFMGLVSEVWGECFTPSLIIKAFDKCGIYPFNRDRYPTDAFAPHLLDLYNKMQTREEQVCKFVRHKFSL